MDNQVTASVVTVFEYGERVMVTDYTAVCGCRWVVDMWGNVRSVEVCLGCVSLDLEFDQLNLQLADDG